MVQVSVNIQNAGLNIILNDKGEVIAQISSTVEGKSLSSALGKALRFAFDNIPKQWDEPEVKIAGIDLQKTYVKLLKGNFIDYSINFQKMVEDVAANIALTSKEAGVEYLRATDTNGVFESVKDKDINTTMVAAQAKVRLTMVKNDLKWRKEDAKASQYNPAYEARLLQNQAKAKAKRLEAKKLKEIENGK